MRRTRHGIGPLLGAALLGALAASAWGCRGDGATAPAGPDSGGEEAGAVASVVVTPTAAHLAALGATRQLEAEARNAAGETLRRVEFTWSSLPARVAAVDSTGTVTAAANGGTEITAAVDTVEGHATVIVRQRTSSVEISPREASLAAAGDTLQFTADPRDRNGHRVADARIRWSSLDTLVATVDSAGRALARDSGETGIVARAGTAADTATLAVAGGS